MRWAPPTFGGSANPCAGSSSSSAVRALAALPVRRRARGRARQRCWPRLTERGAPLRAAERVEAIDRVLRGVPGLRALLAAADVADAGSTASAVRSTPRSRRSSGSSTSPGSRPTSSERANAALVRLKDAVWACATTGCAPPRAVGDLAGRDAGRAAIAAMASVQVALSALDRLEVRGRDSAGLHLLVWDHGLDVDSASDARAVRAARRPAVRRRVRCASPTASSASSTRRPPRSASWATTPRVLRERDHRATSCCGSRCRPERAKATVLGHTRWAQRRHHLRSRTPTRSTARRRAGSTTAPLRRRRAQRRRRQPRRPQGRRGPAHPGRDHHRRQGHPDDGRAPGRRRRRAGEAFRRAVAELRGIGRDRRRRSPSRPSSVLLAQRGSGQALYVGLAEDAFIVASEPYGLVEETTRVRAASTARRRPIPRTKPAAARCSCSTATAPARSTGITAPGLRRHGAAGDRGRRAGRGDHHPRHRPRRPTRTSC